jgi:hypothetical protein
MLTTRSKACNLTEEFISDNFEELAVATLGGDESVFFFEATIRCGSSTSAILTRDVKSVSWSCITVFLKVGQEPVNV